MTRHRDLGAVVLAAVLCAVAALAIPVGWLSLLALAPLAFFLTGYAIQAAAFVEGPQPWPRAFWISLALSLATLALLPLTLNFLGGLTPVTWAIALVLVVLLAVAVAAGRRPADWSEESHAGLRLPRVAPVTALLGLGAMALAAGAIVLAHVPLSNGKAEGFTELSIRPAAEGARVRIGVGNEEQHFTPFRLRATFGVGAGSRVVSREISLEPGQTTSFDLNVTPAPTAGQATFVSVILARPGESLSTPYRRVYGWIPAGPQE